MHDNNDLCVLDIPTSYAGQNKLMYCSFYQAKNNVLTLCMSECTTIFYHYSSFIELAKSITILQLKYCQAQCQSDIRKDADMLNRPWTFDLESFRESP